MADFSHLSAIRHEKLKKAERAQMDKSGSFERKEEYIESVLRKISDGSKSDDFSVSNRSRRSLESPRIHKIRRDREVSLDNSKCSSDSVESRYCSSKRNKKRNTNKKYVRDKTLKNPIQKSKRIAPIPNIVTKDEAEKEIQYTRAMWLKMDAAALGARCLDHLNELELQRSRCSNISGQVAGRMKDSKFIATKITKALIEKLTTVGDVYGLRNEDFSLKEEIEELKRKDQAQSAEIENLRKMISCLERVSLFKRRFWTISCCYAASFTIRGKNEEEGNSR